MLFVLVGVIVIFVILVVTRVLVVVVILGLVMAFITALVYDAANLTRELHRQEDLRSMKSAEWQQLDGERQRNTAQIAVNAEALPASPIWPFKIDVI